METIKYFLLKICYTCVLLETCRYKYLGQLAINKPKSTIVSFYFKQSFFSEFISHLQVLWSSEIDY